MTVAYIVPLSMGPSRAAADFIVTAWSLGTGVFDNSIPQGNQAFNGMPQPSFNQTLNSAYANSIAQAAYQYNYDLATGHFDTQVHVEAQGGSGFSAGSDNTIRFTASSDVMLHAVGQWTFSIPGGFRTTDFNIRVGKVPHDNAFFFVDGGTASPALGDPSIGTFTASLDVFLPAGGTYFFRSIFDFDAFSGSPTALSIGSGYANFTLTSVPEPVALVPLAIIALLLHKHRRCR